MVDHREYFYRRLHSLLGVVPIGIFVVQHLIVNHFVVYGEESFNKAAGFMGSLPFVLVLEIFIIYLPILFHAILGVYIVFTARNNPRKYGFFRNWMFLLQRITGVITLIFIAWHVWQTRIQVALGTAEVNYELMEGILTQPFYFWFYIISIIAVVFHLANGLWGFLVSWGIAQSPRSQQIVTYATIAIFFIVSYIGIRTIIQFGLGA
ncbi:succinate dehydrogenase cytochrome b558 subunit [Pseudogracilibacillus sp. SE30717A]|uniref:succinate dehydrogenase cytochrome b558 subunit n=1 Tax=Pseudogracilibacillus sp. SE30717A TaxID=3098293 RepID=UPI00300E4300